MKKLIWILCLVLVFISGCSNAKETLPALEPDQYLYEVKDKNGNHLYLLGTMHIGASPIDIDGLLKEAYDQSNRIVFEILFDMTEQELIDINTAMLKNPVSDIQSEQMDKIWKEFDDTYTMVSDGSKQFNAMYNVSLASQEIYNDLELKSQYGVDETLYNQAKQDKKTLEAIEGTSMQAEVMREMGEKAPMLMLISMLDKEAQTKAITDMMKAYSEGSIDEAYFEDENEIDESQIPEEYRTGTLNQEMKDYQNILIESRNDGMFDKAKEYLKDNNTLLAVGAGHVIGDNGLVQQFIDAGYEVTKLSNESK